MSEKEKEIIKKLGAVMPRLSEEKKEYFAGVADGISIMAGRSEIKKENGGKKNEKSSNDSGNKSTN